MPVDNIINISSHTVVYIKGSSMTTGSFYVNCCKQIQFFLLEKIAF